MPIDFDDLYPLWLTVTGLLTFVLFGWDKWCARRQWQRIPERVLLLSILSGGFIGGWLGQILFRHKTRKPSFWLTLLLASVGHGYLIWSRWRGAGL